MSQAGLYYGRFEERLKDIVITERTERKYKLTEKQRRIEEKCRDIRRHEEK